MKTTTVAIIVYMLLSGIFIKAMPVSSVATAMLQDAWTHHSSSTQEGAATSNEVTYDNAGIYRLCEVCG